jgi:hypothetical protein
MQTMRYALTGCMFFVQRVMWCVLWCVAIFCSSSTQVPSESVEPALEQNVATSVAFFGK